MKNFFKDNHFNEKTHNEIIISLFKILTSLSTDDKENNLIYESADLIRNIISLLKLHGISEKEFNSKRLEQEIFYKAKRQQKKWEGNLDEMRLI